MQGLFLAVTLMLASTVCFSQGPVPSAWHGKWTAKDDAGSFSFNHFDDEIIFTGRIDFDEPGATYGYTGKCASFAFSKDETKMLASYDCWGGNKVMCEMKSSVEVSCTHTQGSGSTSYTKE